MVARSDLHLLVDELPEHELDAAREALEHLRRRHDDPFLRFLDEAPIDDEPTTPEEEEGVAEALEEIRRGETISADEIKQMLLQ